MSNKATSSNTRVSDNPNSIMSGKYIAPSIDDPDEMDIDGDAGDIDVDDSVGEDSDLSEGLTNSTDTEILRAGSGGTPPNAVAASSADTIGSTDTGTTAGDTTGGGLAAAALAGGGLTGSGTIFGITGGVGSNDTTDTLDSDLEDSDDDDDSSRRDVYGDNVISSADIMDEDLKGYADSGEGGQPDESELSSDDEVRTLPGG